MTTDLILDVNDLHAGYGRAEVLHGLNLKAKAGSVVTVIGPNGAGKSTLLNALMGVLPSRGKIDYQGQSVVLNTLEERVMQGMALVPETRALFGTMPVEDNLLLGAYRQVRLGKKDSAAAIEEVFTLFPRLKERRARSRRPRLRVGDGRDRARRPGRRSGEGLARHRHLPGCGAQERCIGRPRCPAPRATRRRPAPMRSTSPV